jgi:hypothetical protein
MTALTQRAHSPNLNAPGVQSNSREGQSWRKTAQGNNQAQRLCLVRGNPTPIIYCRSTQPVVKLDCPSLATPAIKRTPTRRNTAASPASRVGQNHSDM